MSVFRKWTELKQAFYGIGPELIAIFVEISFSPDSPGNLNRDEGCTWQSLKKRRTLHRWRQDQPGTHTHTAQAEILHIRGCKTHVHMHRSSLRLTSILGLAIWHGIQKGHQMAQPDIPNCLDFPTQSHGSHVESCALQTRTFALEFCCRCMPALLGTPGCPIVPPFVGRHHHQRFPAAEV